MVGAGMNNVTFMVNGKVVGEIQSITIQEKKPEESGFFTGTYEGTLDLVEWDFIGEAKEARDAMVCNLMKGYEAFMEKERRLEKYRQQAREALKELRKKTAIANARQMGKGRML